MVFNGVNRISMDRISFSVTLIHSYSDHKLNISSDSSNVVGTYVLNDVHNNSIVVKKIAGSTSSDHFHTNFSRDKMFRRRF